MVTTFVYSQEGSVELPREGKLGGYSVGGVGALLHEKKNAAILFGKGPYLCSSLFL